MATILGPQLRISGSSIVGSRESFLLILEPWADEFVIHPEDNLRVVAVGETGTGQFHVTLLDGSLIVWLEFENPVNYQLWKNEVLEYECKNAV